MNEGKELIFCTGKYYYSDDKKKRSEKIEEVVTKSNYESGKYQVIYAASDSSKFGYIISRADPNNPQKLALRLVYFTHRAAKDAEPIGVETIKLQLCHSCIPIQYKDFPVITFDKDKIDLPNYAYQYNKTIPENICAWAKKQFKDTYFICGWDGSWSCGQDFTNKTIQRAFGDNSKFSEETKRLLEAAGIPTEGFWGLWSLGKYYNHKKQAENSPFIEFQKKFEKVPNNSAICDGKTVLFKNYVKYSWAKYAEETVGEFSIESGLKLWELDQREKLYVPTKHASSQPKMAEALISALCELPEIKIFERFLRDNKEELFREDQWSTSIYDFLRHIANKKKRRYIENLINFDPESLLVAGRLVLFFPSKGKFIDHTAWDLPHQLGMNKGQLKIIKEWTTKYHINSQTALWTIKLYARQFLPENRYAYVSEPETSAQLPQKFISIATVKDEDILWLLNTLLQYHYNFYTPIIQNAFSMKGLLEQCYSYWRFPFVRISELFIEQNNINIVELSKKLWKIIRKDPNRGASESDTKHNYQDYIRMRETLDLPNKDILYPLMPESKLEITRLHDDLVRIQNTQRDEIRRKTQMQKLIAYTEATKDIAEKMYYEDSKYIIKLCANPVDDLALEGRQLDHCVGSYVEQVLERSTYIFFLRMKTAPDTPFVTINLDTKLSEVIQIHGKCNAWLGNWPEAIIPVNKWIRQHHIRCTDTILRSTAHGYSCGNAKLADIPQDYERTMG